MNKSFYILAAVALIGCGSVQTKPNESVKIEGNQNPLISELDSDKYKNIAIEQYNDTNTSCANPKLLSCLAVDKNTCYKIFRAADVECLEQFYNNNGKDADPKSPFGDAYIKGCKMAKPLKYGQGGLVATMQCMQKK